MLLSIDLETTGIPSKKLALNDPAQPHIVALATLQVNPEDYFVQQSMSKLVIPDGWEWDDSPDSPDRAFQVHKIPVARAARLGRTEAAVLDEFIALWSCDPECHLIAHNLDFEKSVLACAIARYVNPSLASLFLTTPGTCTMLSSRGWRISRSWHSTPSTAVANRSITSRSR